MRATTIHAHSYIRVDEVPDPTITEPTDCAMDERRAVKVLLEP